MTETATVRTFIGIKTRPQTGKGEAEQHGRKGESISSCSGHKKEETIGTGMPHTSLVAQIGTADTYRNTRTRFRRLYTMCSLCISRFLQHVDAFSVFLSR